MSFPPVWLQTLFGVKHDDAAFDREGMIELAVDAHQLRMKESIEGIEKSTREMRNMRGMIKMMRKADADER